MSESVLIWVGFNLFVVAMLALDLGVFHRKSHAVSVREALGWSAFWITLALGFNVVIYLWRGPEAGLQFLTGYLVEKSLSIDNIFVIWMIFSYFCVPAKYQHRILFWGIVGALVMRAGFILAGIALIERFHELIYVFGAFLLYTGVRMGLHRATEIHPDRNPVLRLARRWLPISRQLEGGRFFTRSEGRLMATPLFLVLLVVETTDLIFAVDSIPAILAISRDPFIVYTSNVFAILGLRALYFALAGLVQHFRFLHVGLAAILVFVGAKMLLADVYKVPILVALGVVGCILAVSVVVSLLYPDKTETVGGDDAVVPVSPEMCISDREAAGEQKNGGDPH